MTPQEKEKQVVEFLAKVTNSIPYFIDNEIMESFDITFKYNGKIYQLALIQNGKVKGEDFKLNLN